MTSLAVTGAAAPAPAAAPTAAQLVTRIAVPTRLPPRYDGQPMRHLSHSSYTRFLLCPEDFRRHYIKGERTPPSGAMFLGARVDDALTTYYQRILEHGDTLTLDQVKDAYRDHWNAQLETEQAKRGVDWDPELTEAAAFDVGLGALELTFSELVPQLGRPVAAQRKLEFALAPTLEWLSRVAERLLSMSSWVAGTVPSGALSTVRSGCRLRRRGAAGFSASLSAASGLGR